MLRQAVILADGVSARDGTGGAFLTCLFDEIGRHGLTDIVLLAGEAVGRKFQGTHWHGATVRWLQNAASLADAAPMLDERFIVMTGGGFFRINLLALIRHAETSGAEALAALRPDGTYGGVYVMNRALAGRVEILPPPPGLFQPVVFDAPIIAAPQVVAARPAMFFDRDGVLNIDTGYVYRPTEFEWNRGAIDAIRLLNDAGWLVFVVTNQSGVARGYYEERDVCQLHDWMNGVLAGFGAHIDAFYYCPHYVKGTVDPYIQDCDCRKPEPGMLLSAFAEWSIDKAASRLIGDKQSDIDAAVAAGIPGVLITPADDVVDVVRRATGILV